ncbi:hypothetical protein [Sphingomonas mesophila]|uniref:hypothetical protein n=1 Tax=Sphingomonas mesophila TaxID=2303576 RepID=UPI000E5905F5|nr:hypothetical protein [Sphingomonas mesophila]
MHRLSTVCAALIALAAVAACGESSGDDQLAPLERGDRSQVGQRSPDRGGWGERLLSIVPARSETGLPTVDSLQRALAPCGPGQSPCNLAARPGDGPTVKVTMDATSQGVRTVALAACCSDQPDFFSPLESLALIRTTLFCPELTIAASQPVEAFRVSAPGRRDFVYTTATESTPAGQSITFTAHFATIETGKECKAISAGARAGNTEFAKAQF